MASATLFDQRKALSKNSDKQQKRRVSELPTAELEMRDMAESELEALTENISEV
jgi:hypothetical protein